MIDESVAKENLFSVLSPMYLKMLKIHCVVKWVLKKGDGADEST